MTLDPLELDTVSVAHHSMLTHLNPALPAPLLRNTMPINLSVPEFDS